ncbi:SGNH/GDSL hydrolase family protein [Saccharicrinis sp. 156]|uniref:SGNH/GDSL hydrolase family protein n=1 Tax=Saccharicrinis sp. 156 TaxID=3417574 RepID=UPI003D3415E2
MKILIGVFILMISVFTVHARNNLSDTVFIQSLEELANYAVKSNVLVKMKPGEYTLCSTKISQHSTFKQYKKGLDSTDFVIASLIHFSGNNSSYYLSGVTISIDTKFHKKFGNKAKRIEFAEVLVSGSHNYIEGLKARDLGDDVPAHRVQMLRINGDNNIISKADLFVHGSTPYGYGHLLGKGRNALVPLHKHSVLLVEGMNTKLLKCKVVTHAYGHGIFMQGAVNTLLKDCYVEGKMRPTNEMLAETSGLAFDVDFKSDYPPGKIMPDEMKALSEDGIRTYPKGGLHERRTQGVTVINCTVKNMRSGFDLSANLPPTKVVGSTVIGCQEKGFSIGTNGVIENCKGDAMYGPLITFITKDIKNCKVDLELVDTVSQFQVHRLAEINGSGHQISIRNHKGRIRKVKVPIVFGESFWADVHQYRKPGSPLGTYAGANNITLVNKTEMPVIFNELTSNCKVVSDDNLLTDQGEITIVNKGVGGNSTLDLLKRLDKDVLKENPDLVILMVGANDMLNSRKMLSYAQYSENLEKIVRTVKESGSQVLMMSSPPVDSAYLFQRHDRTKYKQAPNEIMDSVSHIVKGIAFKNKVLFVNLFEEFMALSVPVYNQDLFIRNIKNSNKADGVHPTSLGYHFIANVIYQYLKENKLLKNYKKIICFGDSITNGAGAKGSGTVKGENYPSYLNKLINNY